MRRKVISALMTASMLTVYTTGCGGQNVTLTQMETVEEQAVTEEESDGKASGIERYVGMTAEEITATLTLEEKVNQMMISAVYNMGTGEMAENNYGSILSTYGFVEQTPEDWSKLITEYQENAMKSSAPIPFIYGQDSVHGVNYSLKTVIFPHNINIGAANDEELTYQMGLAVADEIKMTKMLWNYAPCVAVVKDPRWGRTYESYSSDAEIVQNLSGSYTRGLLDGGVIACPKHYLGDGGVEYGTGESDLQNTRLIDRGDAALTEDEIAEQLAIYQNLIDIGTQSIMISHSSLNGVKMHANKYYMTDVLRKELGFEGVVVSDWESIHNLDRSLGLKEQVIISVNAGIDLLMEPESYETCAAYLIEGVQEGTISEERIDEAVTRIIQLKLDAGMFEDPYLQNLEIQQDEPGSEEYRDLARQLVEESLVLIKNENEVLPIQKGAKIFVTGPAANDIGVQCGGWTRMWNGMTDAEYGGKLISSGTTILEGLRAMAEEYDLTIITDEAQAAEADITLLCLGEKPYAEWNGDTADLELTGRLRLPGNENAIALVKELGKPTITLLVAGRNVIIDEYIEQWDSVVMCYLFGSEGDGVANMLLGKRKFTGRLPMPWYRSIEDLEAGTVWLEVGYGLE